MTKTKTDALVAATGVDVAELASFKQQGTQLVDFLESIQSLDTPEKEAWASQRRADVGALLKLLEDNRKSLKAPLLEAGRRVDGLFKPSTAPLEKAEEILIKLLKDAATARDAAERAAMLAAEAAAAKQDDGAVMAALAQVPTTPLASTGGSTKVKWVVDHIDVSKLDRSYVKEVADEDKIDGELRAANAAGTEPRITGVTFKREAAFRRKG